MFQYDYARAEATLSAARDFVCSALRDLEEAAARDGLTMHLRARARLAPGPAGGLEPASGWIKV